MNVDHQENPDQWVNQVSQVTLECLDHQDQEVSQEKPVMMVVQENKDQWDLRVMMVNQENREHPDHLVNPVFKDNPGLQESRVYQVEMEKLDQLEDQV